jgi:hypothetical protein
MPEMLSAYIRMCAESEMQARPRSDRDAAMDDVYCIHVVDMFGKFYIVTVPRRTDDCQIRLTGNSAWTLVHRGSHRA